MQGIQPGLATLQGKHLTTHNHFALIFIPFIFPGLKPTCPQVKEGNASPPEGVPGTHPSDTHLGVCASSTRLPNWNSWDLLRCRAVNPGIKWISFLEEGGGVPGGFNLFFLRMGGVPGGVTVVTMLGVRGGVRTVCLCRGDGGSERWPDSRGGGGHRPG